MILVGLICLAVFFLPTIIAFSRNHHYKWVVFAINLILGATGVGFLIALVWAVWPQKTALADVLINDPTTNSPEASQKIYRQMGQNIRAFNEGRNAASLHPPAGCEATKCCPFCGEIIKSQAIKCKHCKSTLKGPG